MLLLLNIISIIKYYNYYSIFLNIINERDSKKAPSARWERGVTALVQGRAARQKGT